jgi:aldose 1-epimerase
MRDQIENLGLPFSPEGLARRRFLQLSGAALAGTAIGACGSQTLFAADQDAARQSIRREPFGKLADGTAVDTFTFANSAGMEVKVMTFGATMMTVKVPDRAGKLESVNLYLDTLEDYVQRSPLFGAVAGRYANRISNARFTIDGKPYKLTANAGPHHIHGGGKAGFDKVVWQAEPSREADGLGVKFTHVSPDGEAGYPGTLTTTVKYTLTADNRLILDYTAQTDKPTHINLTNHAYWNLAGAGSGDVLGHILWIDADRYLAADRAKIPSGEILNVKGTPQDFTLPTAVGARIDQVEDKNYDHCYVLNKPAGQAIPLAARVKEPRSGRMMEVFTTQPAVQLYTARGLNSRLKGGGKPYGPYHGLCLETEHYPDSPNRPEFPSTLLRPGETFHQVTIYRFAIA